MTEFNFSAQDDTAASSQAESNAWAADVCDTDSFVFEDDFGTDATDTTVH